MLGEQESTVLAWFCALVVPGSTAAGAVSYVDRRLGGMAPAEEDAVHAAIGLVATCAGAEEALARLTATDGFQLLRTLAIEAFYGDYRAPDATGPTGHEVIGFAPPQATRLHKDWSFLDSPTPATPPTRRESAEVVVVGSGAGGGLIAAELGRRGHDVFLVEAGGCHPAEDRLRFELAARHQLWWPHRSTVPRTDDDEPVALLAGRCVGGTTVINTKVAMRVAPVDVERCRQATGITLDLDPWYAQVEERLGVRVRDDWSPSVHRVNKGFAALGTALEPVRSYTDYTCNRCGSCTTGCPTNAGRDALNTFLAPALARREIRLRTHCLVTRLTMATSGHPRVTGVRYRNPDGTTGDIDAPVVVLAAGSLNTPQILLCSGEYVGLDTPSTRLVGATLGLHPARLVYGRFDEPQDCHQIYPITAHCLAHQEDFVVEGTTIQEPVSFAASLVDDRNRPVWGADLSRVARDYRHWAGLLVMANDENTGTVELDAAGNPVFTKGFSATEWQRLSTARTFTADVLHAAGATDVVWSGLSTSHVQGTARMGPDPSRSVVDEHGRAHGVDGLYVGDGSVLPSSLSVNPSLTIMALAARIADHLAGELV